MFIGKFIDLTGQVFGRLKVLRRADIDYIESNGRHSPQWLCECSCEEHNQIIVSGRSLRSKNTQSCGCLQREVRIENNKKYKKKYNTYDLSGEYGIGYTTKGEEFYFDLEDYNKIKDYCWRIHNKGYVACSINMGKDKSKKDLLMHILIMDGYDDKLNIKMNIEIDHKNGIDSRNDNRRFNLRECTHQENMCNYPIPSNNTSGVTGVSWCNTHKKWKAYITYKGKRKSLGYHNRFESAVKVRKEAEEKYFGEYSYDNSRKDSQDK